jgi:phosphoserine phosphatase
MTVPAQGEPGWLRRSDEPQPFVVTICGYGGLDDALALLQAQLGGLQIKGQDRPGKNAINVTTECLPTQAWSLLQVLRDRLSSADVYVQPEAERGKRLLICDMDMTIVDAETLDEVAARLGMGDEIAAITERAMHGEIDFNAALRERIAMLAGQPERVFHEVAQEIGLNPGAKALLDGARAAGVHTILISGGFSQVAEPVAARLGFDELHCNHLELQARTLTGRVREPIINADLKCQVLQQSAQMLGIGLRECCAIGDGANDLPMLSAAGLGIAYHAKPVLRSATSCHIDATDLESALFFMGYGRGAR